VSPSHVSEENRDSDTKVFCFFSSEKKALLSCAPLLRHNY
jgi:hypothetical protein